MNNFNNDIINKFKKGSMLTKLIYINVSIFISVYLVLLFLPENSQTFLSVPGSFNDLLKKPWTLITYMFTHFEFLHILFNMLWLFWFGGLFLNYFNEKQMLAVYLLGGIFAAFIHLGVNYFLNNPNIGIVGASAAVMSIVFAVVAYRPDFIMYLLFFGPVKIKYIALTAFIIDLAGMLKNVKGGNNASDGIAHIAHMGGALYGLWFGYSIKKGKDITRSFNNFLNSLFSWFKSNKYERNRSKMKPSRDSKFSKPKTDWDYNSEKKQNEEELNRILEKIKEKGYNSLSAREKEFLFSQKK